jgi:hypothetical protein
MLRPDTRPRPPKRTAPGAQDAQRAEESKQADFAQSNDVGLVAALWAIREAIDATRMAGQCVVCGNPTAGINALNRAGRAMSAASDSLQGLMQ